MKTLLILSLCICAVHCLPHERSFRDHLKNDVLRELIYKKSNAVLHLSKMQDAFARFDRNPDSVAVVSGEDSSVIPSDLNKKYTFDLNAEDAQEITRIMTDPTSCQPFEIFPIKGNNYICMQDYLEKESSLMAPSDRSPDILIVKEIPNWSQEKFYVVAHCFGDEQLCDENVVYFMEGYIDALGEYLAQSMI